MCDTSLYYFLNFPVNLQLFQTETLCTKNTHACPILGKVERQKERGKEEGQRERKKARKIHEQD